MLHLPTNRLRRYALIGIGILFIASGVNHFVSFDAYLPMMPDWLPAHGALIRVSGFLEVAGGVSVFLFPRHRSLVGWFLIAVMVAVFPANVHMALNPHEWPNIPGWALWARLPVQGVLIVWAWWATRTGTSDSTSPSAR